MNHGDDLSFASEIQQLQWLDQEDARMADAIRRHGWAVQVVFGEGCWGPPNCPCDRPRGVSPPYAYTIGLHGFDHPELLIYGMDPHTSAKVLNDLGERVRRGQSMTHGEVVTFTNWPHRLKLFTFRDDAETPALIGAQRYYQRTRDNPVPALQCVWDDRGRRFPWDEGYEPPAGLQPLPQSHTRA
ncbi:DUF4262 domain-containing protein [Phytoactinopolyspora halotolerans]|uniref:DUF4262 domain-containing protein n=1 Tax=Phytoactinopolyspora halotolerans TaxID=1981512 RepID=A0A6L9SIT4_9ACTN|nr:DUF4262 domain-containing protein [Phytoactinopolyspora halotolerans]NEE04584.1 DUF4262 domain-containing protein [Phytoactinopolyspora halotolerans]